MPGAHFGGWTPGRTNALLLLIQVGFAIQAAARGMDYVLPSPPGPIPRVLTVVEASAPLPLWGCGFLLGAGLVVLGLSGGWRWFIVAGHGVLGSLYVGFGAGILQAAAVTSWLQAAAGALLLVPGFWLVLTRRPPRWVPLLFGSATLAGVLLAAVVSFDLPWWGPGLIGAVTGVAIRALFLVTTEQARFLASMVTVGVGGWTCALGLGYDFRTATGLIIAGVAHCGFAVGIAWAKGNRPRQTIG